MRLKAEGVTVTKDQPDHEPEPTLGAPPPGQALGGIIGTVSSMPSQGDPWAPQANGLPDLGLGPVTEIDTHVAGSIRPIQTQGEAPATPIPDRQDGR